MLAQRGMTDIHVYERLPAPPLSASNSEDTNTTVWDDGAEAIAKYYLLGLGGRGQQALQKLDQHARATNTTTSTTTARTVWETVDHNTVTVRGRNDWAPGAGIDEGT